MKDRPFIHLFKVSTGNYIYDVNTGKIIKVPPKVYEVLENNDMENTGATDYITMLKKRGYLKTKKVKHTLHPATPYLEYYLKNKISSLVLQLTQECNMRCSYCVYSGGYENRKHTGAEMDIALALKGIDFLLNHSCDVEDLYIAFYGGEPLLKFELIKECIKYSLEHSEGRRVHFNITTNGTLLTKEVVEVLEKYHVSTLISLDGPPEIHNRSRKFADESRNTQEVVIQNLEMIKKEHPSFFKTMMINAVVNQGGDFKTVDQYFTCKELFQPIDIVFSVITSNYSKKKNDISEEFMINEKYEMFKLFLMKLGWLEEKDVSRLLRKEQLLLGQFSKGKLSSVRWELPDIWHRGGPCIPGVRSLFLNSEGDFYPCEKVSELSDVARIGNINTGLSIEKVSNILNLEKRTEENCHNCWAYEYCSLCIAQVDDLTDISVDAIHRKCEGIREAVESDLKDYCVLKELGYDFETDGLLKLK